MVTINQVKTGLMKYIDTDMLPHLSGVKKVGLGVYAALAADNASRMVLQYKEHPAISVLDVVDKDGNIDIDKLYNAAVPMFSSGQKHSVNIPLVGEYVIDQNDIEKIYRYIREA